MPLWLLAGREGELQELAFVESGHWHSISNVDDLVKQT
jgi:hypothetical protein